MSIVATRPPASGGAGGHGVALVEVVDVDRRDAPPVVEGDDVVDRQLEAAPARNLAVEVEAEGDEPLRPRLDPGRTDGERPSGVGDAAPHPHQVVAPVRVLAHAGPMVDLLDAWRIQEAERVP